MKADNINFVQASAWAHFQERNITTLEISLPLSLSSHVSSWTYF